MLQLFRKRLQGWVAGFIVTILCLAFALFGVQYYVSNARTKNVVAKVNGHTIEAHQLQSAYLRALADYPRANMADAMFQKQLKARVLEAQIQQIALQDVFKNAGYTISLNQIAAVVEKIPAFQIKGHFSPMLFRDKLSRASYAPHDFLSAMGNNILMQQAQSSMTQSNFVLPNEVHNYDRLLHQRRDFGYLIIPTERFAAAVHVPRSQIKNYYSTHPLQFSVPEKVRLHYIILSAGAISDKITPSEKQMHQYYRDNQSHFVSPKKWQLARILVKLPKGAGSTQEAAALERINAIFKDIEAKKSWNAVSIDDKHKTIIEKQAPIWIDQLSHQKWVGHVAALKPGDVSRPFRTQEGWNIVKVLAISEPKTLRFSDVKAKIAKRLKAQKTARLLSRKTDQLSNAIYMHPGSLEPAASALNLPIHTTAFFDRQGTPSGFLSHAKVLSAAFSDSVLKDGSNSDLINLDDQTVAVVHLAGHKLPTVAPLRAVYATIEAKLRKQAMQHSARQLAEKIKKALRQGENPASVAAKYQLHWATETGVARVQKERAHLPSGLLHLVFSQFAPGARRPVLASGKLTDKQYAVIAIYKISYHDHPGLDTQAAQMRSRLLEAFVALDRSLYTQHVITHARIHHMIHDR